MIKIILAALLFSANAFATGGTYCSVDNADVKLEVNLTNGRYFGSPLVNPSTVEVEFKNSPLIGFTNYTFKKDQDNDEIPYWFNLSNELKLGAIAEPSTDADGNPIDAFISLSVVIDAKWVSELEGGYYAGTYTVTQSSNSVGPGQIENKYEGYIKCEIE